MNRIGEIKQLLLQGEGTEQIMARYPLVSPSSLGTYIRRALAQLDPEQRKAIRETLRPLRGSTYHRKFEEQQVRSPIHVRVGARIVAARQDSDMNLTKFSRAHPIANRIVLAQMEQGYHDFTLTELQRIADTLCLSLDELLRPLSGETTT